MRRALDLSPLFLVLTLTALHSGCGGDEEGAPAPEDGEGQGWAVVVGISEYENFPSLEEGVAGAERMGRVFNTSWGVPEENIRMLLDADATRDALRETLAEWLPGSVGANDFVLVYLGGYGSAVEDISGDEEDGLDEAFCPVDALPGSYGNDILDDSLSHWLGQLPTDRVTLIMEGHQFGQGDHDPDHPGHEEHAEQFPPMEAVGVSRCGDRPIQEG